MITDVVLTYQFMKRFVLPFHKWKAYRLGIIDENGKILRPRSTLVTSEERSAFGTFDVIVLNMKRLLAKVPGGGSLLGSAAAALVLAKEETAVDFLARALESEMLIEDAPTNSAGSGQVAGLGQGAQGEPPAAGYGAVKRVLRRKRVRTSRTDQ